MTMQTYLNSPDLKARFLAEITKHEEQDALIKGSYGEMNGMFRGCAIGCALHSLNVLQGESGHALLQGTGDHARYEKELGLPIWFAYMEDQIFENLPLELAKTWPRRVADAIPVGAVVDDMVLAKFLRWVLADADFGVRFATDDAEIRGLIDGVIAGFDAEISTGGQATAEQRARAARVARAAMVAWDARAAWAAWDARDAWAARAAWDTRDAWDAWDARAARVDLTNSSRAVSRSKAEAFFPALSEFVLSQVRELAASSVTQ